MTPQENSHILAQLAMLSKGANTERFHTVPHIKTETVGHHSALVAGLVYMLWPEKHYLLPYAIFHDLPEHVTGDIPSPGKRLFVDRAKLKAAEAALMQEAGFLLLELSPEDERRLKIADILAGVMTCRRELRMGNRLMAESMENYRSYLQEIGPHTPQVWAIANELYKVISYT